MATLRGRILAARSTLHRTVFTATRGRVLRTWGGLPVVLLTTRGRRSGLARRTILVSPLQHRGSVVVVASNGGAPRHPDWFLNLEACPVAHIRTQGRSGRVHARTATAQEARAFWSEIEQKAPSYGRYRQRAARIIPLVVLEPSADQDRLRRER